MSATIEVMQRMELQVPEAPMHAGDRVARERGLRSAVLAGDERAWRAWYEEAFDGLYAYISWRCAGRRELTEEMVQETWLAAVRRIGSFDPERGSFAAWLGGIAANVLRNRFRKRRTQRPVQSLARHSVPAEDDSLDAAERVAVALAALPERYEAVLRAKYLDQRSVAEIADDAGDTPKAIESLLTRARQAFREAYARTE